MIVKKYPTNAEIIALRKKRKKRKKISLGYGGRPNYVPDGATDTGGSGSGGHQGGG